jgi:rhodanese-related sulfurtransferase
MPFPGFIGYDRRCSAESLFRDLRAIVNTEEDMEITPEELAEKLRGSPPPHLLDVREPEEFALTQLEGAQLIPLGELAARLGELPPGELVVYCHHGVRSLQAVGLLRAHDRSAVSLRGGIDAWARQIDPSLPRY